jgi:pyridoxamine 5'-phosphate oxidase
VPDLRATLRSLPVLQAPPVPFDPLDVPEDPVALFTAWLHHAVEAGVPEPHAVTLSTVDEHGHPDARVLILKDVDASGWVFAASADSPKGRQLARTPRAALSCHWPLLARQVRIRGEVRDRGPEAAAADFLARSPDARAEVLLARQSRVRPPDADDGPERAEARRRLAADPGLLAPAWRSYVLRPREVEFWQGAATRRHTRLRYRLGDGDGAWVREQLWP